MINNGTEKGLVDLISAHSLCRPMQTWPDGIVSACIGTQFLLQLSLGASFIPTFFLSLFNLYLTVFNQLFSGVSRWLGLESSRFCIAFVIFAPWSRQIVGLKKLKGPSH